MKKLLIIPISLLIIALSGCEIITGEYKEGTYFGYAYDEDYDTYATAIIYVNEAGIIKSVFIDSTYINKTKSLTTPSTKKIEGDDYNMKKYSNATLEWYLQAEKIEEYILEHQSFDIELNDSGKTDAVSGARISLTAIDKAVKNALGQAK